MDDPTAREVADRQAAILAGARGEPLAGLEDGEGVGTGAGEGAAGQDTDTAWVTRSTDCPEAPAQAHPLAHADALSTLLAETLAGAREDKRPRMARAPVMLTSDEVGAWSDGYDAALSVIAARLGIEGEA